MSGPDTAPAINIGLYDVLAEHNWQVLKVFSHGLAGVGMQIRTPDDRVGSIIISQAFWHDDSQMWVHASISFHDQDPTYADLTILHRAVFGRSRYAFQVFAPVGRHVNLHEHALHLWSRADGKNPLPDFGRFGTI